VRGWGFDLGAISVPVAIWHGGEDRFVPYAHGRWLAEHVAGATPHLHSDHGHLSLAIGSYDAVLDDLIAHPAIWLDRTGVHTPSGRLAPAQ